MYLRILFLSILLTSCGSAHVAVKKVNVGPESLASRFARSPDPLEVKPPVGEKLYVNWRMPHALGSDLYKIRLSVIYKDLSEETFIHPITWQIGVTSFSLLDDKFKQKRGFFSYKAEIINDKDEVLDTWQHQMWVNVIH